jgi:hypothetical protein
MKAKELSCNDLMIGDWVLDGNIYVQVTSITCDGIIETTHNEHSNIELVKPIPLTQEILEKNGIKWFCTEPSGRKTFCCNEPVVQCTYIPNSGWLINVGACGSIKVRFVEISKIQYVHELQHALRLCGISKEIEL